MLIPPSSVAYIVASTTGAMSSSRIALSSCIGSITSSITSVGIPLISAGIRCLAGTSFFSLTVTTIAICAGVDAVGHLGPGEDTGHVGQLEQILLVLRLDPADLLAPLVPIICHARPSHCR